ncbi:hypothetical protein D3C80_574510 [compost metagenome]
MQGGEGNDVLVGSSANDFMVGGDFASPAGTDQFKFGAIWGQDEIFDFEDGVEKIDLSATNLAIGDLTIADSFGSTQITVTADVNGDIGSITLTGVPAANVTADDFVFA